MADTVYDLEDSMIQGLAGESNDVVEERAKAAQKLKLLQNCLHDLKRLDKYGATHSQRTVGQEYTTTKAKEEESEIEEGSEEVEESEDE